MGITLESIYKPVNDFFLNTFKSDANAPVEFRLQQYATVVNEEDFEGLNNADEMSSDLVNEIPYVDDKGLNVVFTPNNIDTVYEFVLSALPFFDESLNDDEKEAVHDSFIRAKNQVLRDWENYSHVRGNGITDLFRLTNLTPSNWFDSESNIWQKREFEIKEPKASIDSTKSDKQLNILKIRMTDAQLLNVLPMLDVSKKVKPQELKLQVVKMQPTFFAMPFMANKIKPPQPKRIIRDHRNLLKTAPSVQKAVLSRRIDMKKKPQPKKETTVQRTAIGLKFSNAFHGLKFNEKIAVKDFIKEKSPSKPIMTNGVSIRFEYCVVNIKRGWFNEVFCNINRSWYIPDLDKGALSAPNVGALTHLPVAFVAVKDLNISANWDGLDKKELENAVSFGPFDINNQNIQEKGSLSHKGIQIIGWMLQKLPELPPRGKS